MKSLKITVLQCSLIGNIKYNRMDMLLSSLYKGSIPSILKVDKDKYKVIIISPWWTRV